MNTATEKKQFGFEVLAKDPSCGARTGRVRTAHGDFLTPVFMPVGTQGTVKGLLPRDLHDLQAEIILSNTYHLFIRPGVDILLKAQGLHRFMGWSAPILTDSGGYQVFSLSRLREITEKGVTFRSHVDGKEIFLGPEVVMDIQEAIGSDIAMIFDECPPPTLDQARIRQACELTTRWAERAKKHHRLKSQALFGIIQGGVFPELRLEHLQRITDLDFDGYALGGLCVGENKDDTFRIFREVIPAMPENKPRYMMGIGTPIDFLEAVEQGADMFDCVTPTRYGRNGTAFTSRGLIVVRNGKYHADFLPLDETCGCYTCRNFSRSYLRHLFNTDEMLGLQLVSLHNVYFFVHFLKAMRTAIEAGGFLEFKRKFTDSFDPGCR
ncbi:MAG: tRNA guanosine(34) transglycosylase Tgt [Candidatus Omnitrophica bacterium]|nr:tRNA guanosine(34) transglycosylase Tgt [Candidatus Omnitrophota bacterium]